MPKMNLTPGDYVLFVPSVADGNESHPLCEVAEVVWVSPTQALQVKVRYKRDKDRVVSAAAACLRQITAQAYLDAER
jgi:hypothetical protein